jgi:hypothetical protein
MGSGYWNGESMYSSNENILYPPEWFKYLIPKDLALEGELWTKIIDLLKDESIFLETR